MAGKGACPRQQLFLVRRVSALERRKEKTMKSSALMLLVLVVGAGSAAAQPMNGDLIITYSDNSTFTTGNMLILKPQSSIVTTLTLPPAGYAFARVTMAENNTDLICVTASGLYAPARKDNLVLQVDPSGAYTTRTMIQGKGNGYGIELDHDGWILAMYEASNDGLACLQGNTMSTLWSKPRNVNWGWFANMTMDRDPGSPPYVIARRWGSSSTLTPRLLGVDRKGIVSTLYSNVGDFFDALSSIDLDPATGDYLVCVGPTGTSVHSLVALFNKNRSKITTLQGASTIPFPYAAKIGQDRKAWIARGDVAKGIVISQLDIQKNQITRTLIVNNPLVFPTDIEIYGSRVLTCRQPVATPLTVTVDVMSHHTMAPGAQYVLAASFGRRPGVQFASSEWLHLNVTDPLFALTALNLAPSIFTGFRGTLDPFGRATATVNLPKGLPASLTVFVAGLILKGANIIQVTNTHWFVLP